MNPDEIAMRIAAARQHPQTRGVTGDALIALADLIADRERRLIEEIKRLRGAEP